MGESSQYSPTFIHLKKEELEVIFFCTITEQWNNAQSDKLVPFPA